MRLSIDITQEQHQRLKASAALQDRSIKDYVLEHVLPPSLNDSNGSEQEALRELESLLASRIQNAEQSAPSDKSVRQIFEEVHRDMR